MKTVKCVLGILFLITTLWGQLDNPGFEGNEPNYFSTGGTSTTAVLSWATDQYRTGGRSLKIVKGSADGSASWVSDDLYRFWDVFVGQDVGMEVGAWVKLDGVNTSIASNDDKIQLIFRFLDATDIDLLGGPLVLDVPQDQASTEWLEVVSATPLSFPVTVDKITIEVKSNNDATGTVYVDDIFIRPTTEGDWVGDFFNPNVDVPDGWFYWWPDFSTGGADWAPLGKVAEWGTPAFAGQTQDEAHSGVSSLKMQKDATGYEIVVNSDPVDFENDGSPLVFSVYVKTDLPEGMADLANSDPSNAMGFTVTWHDGTMGADGWGEVGGSDYRFNVAGDQSDWTLYQGVLTPPAGATQFSLRARYWHNFMGTTYWDDFHVKKAYPSEDLANPGFEGDEPNYFSPAGTPTDAVLSWATDEYRTGGRSLKIVKPTTNYPASWVSEDLYRYWSVFVSPDVGMEVGAWVKMAGVGQGPAADAKAQLIFHFLDIVDNDLFGGPFVIDLPSNISSSDWFELKNTFTPISFPVTVAKITVEVLLNTQVTGTVWVDDFFIRPATEGEWAGDFFNPNVDVPDGWFYWWPDFSAGKPDWAPLGKVAAWDTPVFAGQTQDEARSGVSSLKMRKDATGYEVVVNSDPVDFVNDGTPLVFSAWVKTDLPEGMADLANSDPSNAMGFTVTWHDGTMGADGWGEVGGSDYRFTVAGDSTDWIQYQGVLTPPANATQFSLRARYWHNFIGTTYWDDFSVMRTIPLATEDEYDNTVSTPREFRLLDAYPNPFNPQVNIAFEMPQEGNVKLSIYDISGQLVSTLINNNTFGVGKHRIQWNAMTNNGTQVPTGIYLVRLELDGLETKLTKITYMK